jgi:hypothetical protein
MFARSAAGAAAAKAAVVTVISLPLLVASVANPPTSAPHTSAVNGRSGQPATVDMDTDRGFLLGSALTATLYPGATVPIRLTFTNPSAQPVAVEELVVTIDRVNAAAADCGPDDFDTQQFSGRYGFRVAADQTTDLAALGFPAAQWPQLTMLYRPTVNQDGCKGASVSLALRGSAVGEPS